MEKVRRNRKTATSTISLCGRRKRASRNPDAMMGGTKHTKRVATGRKKLDYAYREAPIGIVDARGANCRVAMPGNEAARS